MSTIRNIRPRPMESNDSRKPQRAFLKRSIGVRSGDLHRDADGYPGRNHRMLLCCGAMRDAMRDGDSVESPRKAARAPVCSFAMSFEPNSHPEHDIHSVSNP